MASATAKVTVTLHSNLKGAVLAGSECVGSTAAALAELIVAAAATSCSSSSSSSSGQHQSFRS